MMNTFGRPRELDNKKESEMKRVGLIVQCAGFGILGAIDWRIGLAVLLIVLGNNLSHFTEEAK